MKNIIDALNWRYATKAFDKDKKLSESQLMAVTEAMRLSASSFGLQPWKFIVVTDPEIRKALRAAAWDQSQITDASHLIVIAVNSRTIPLVDSYMQSIADTRGIPVEALKGFSDSIKGSLAGKTPQEIKDWSSRQLYIALGIGLVAAASESIDACPMEGFDPQKFDEILGLTKMGLESRALLALGFRSPDDKTASYKKVRFPRSEVFIEVK
jgi:nitroreductase